MVMRPILRFVIIFGDVVDLVFGFDVSVLRATDVDADPVLCLRLEIHAAVRQRLARTVDRDGPRPGTDAELFFLLKLQRIVVANAGELLAHIAHVDALDARNAVEKVVPELGQRIAVRGSKANTGDDDAR